MSSKYGTFGCLSISEEHPATAVMSRKITQKTPVFSILIFAYINI
jgi:hypothetical protein